MIQVYLPQNTDYTHNGDAVIFPEIAEITPELNGTWYGQLSVPVAEGSGYQLITEGVVIKMPSYNGDQLFRVVNPFKDTSAVTADLQPIFFDSAKDCFITDTRPTNKNGQQALDLLCANNPKYSGESDIATEATAYYEYVNLLEAIAGDEDNTFLSRWGGEIEYNNFTIRVMNHLGEDRGEEFRYGKNIQGITQAVNDSEVITRIYPKGYNGIKMSDSGYVDSPLINSYPIVKAGTITFSEVKMAEDVTDDEQSDPDLIICNNQAEVDAALTAKCNEQFDLGIDKPIVTIEIDSLADLRKIQGFENFGTNISLGDTVYCKHEILGITTNARVVSLTFDSVNERVSRLTIGQLSDNYIDSLSATINRVESAIRKDGSVKAETVAGVINLIKTSLYRQYDAASVSETPAILFENNDLSSDMYGAMAIGTQGFQIARQKDSSGKWIFETWGTSAGIIANYIIAGILSARDGLSYWDLDNSKLRFHDAENDKAIEFDLGVISFLTGNDLIGQLHRKAGQDKDGNPVEFIGLAHESEGTYKSHLSIADGIAWLSVAEDTNLYEQPGYARLKTEKTNIVLNSDFGNDSLTYAQIISGDAYLNVNGKNKQVSMSPDYNTYNPMINLLKTDEEIRLICTTLKMNGYAGYSGTITISGHTITVKNGIITGVS